MPSAQPACLPTTKGIAPWTRFSDSAEARFPQPPGRSRARRASCSCTQLSKTRTSMNVAWGTSPTGLQPTAAHSSSPRASSWASRVRVTSSNSSWTVGPGNGRRTAIHRSLREAKSFFTWSPSGPSHAGSGWPMMVRSIPMRWESWSLTSHPGHSVGRLHSVADSSWVTSERPPHVSAQRRCGFQPPLQPITALTCAVVRHRDRPYPPARACGVPGRCLWPDDHPPFLVTLPLRSSPVQGHHRPEELPWLTTRGTA